MEILHNFTVKIVSLYFLFLSYNRTNNTNYCFKTKSNLMLRRSLFVENDLINDKTKKKSLDERKSKFIACIDNLWILNL